MRRIIPALCFAAALFVSSSAFAEDAATQAQAHFEAGAEFYFGGEYGKAIVEFMKGHAIMPNGLFLYNISLSHVKLGNTVEALENAEAARAMGDLDEGTTTQNDGRIVALRAVLKSRAMVPEQLATGNGNALVEDAQTSSSDGFGALGWVGVGSTVIGGGLLAGAMVMELGLRDTWDDYETAAANGETARYNELKTQIEDDQSTGILLLAAGSGATVIGITLIAVELMSDDDEETSASTIYMQPRPGGGIVGFSGAF